MPCSLISITEVFPSDELFDVSPEQLIVYLARVSSPQNQGDFYSGPRLLRYLIDHCHWSPFEMVDMTVRIQTTRAIAAQILRHRSFSFQEFSQRYATVRPENAFLPCLARRQDKKNRQQSTDDLPPETQEWFTREQTRVFDEAYRVYTEALEKGVAKECARFVLPLNTVTTMYMKGSIRSWIHYLQLRTKDDVQKEHRDIAVEIRGILCRNFPYTAQALGWIEGQDTKRQTEGKEE